MKLYCWIDFSPTGIDCQIVVKPGYPLQAAVADQLRDHGYKLEDAIKMGARVRLRPVSMTLISTVLGGLPLILGSGAGAEARESIGWVVFGGLGIAALFTLYLTPALYFLIARFSAARAHEAARLKEELKTAELLLDQH